MELKTTLISSVLLYLIGAFAFFGAYSADYGFWFLLGGGLALFNVFYAAWVIRYGLQSAKKKSFFLGLLFFKSMTFLTMVGVIMMFLKPLVLPFTLGILIVMFGAVIAALWEAKRWIKRSSVANDMGTLKETD